MCHGSVENVGRRGRRGGAGESTIRCDTEVRRLVRVVGWLDAVNINPRST